MDTQIKQLTEDWNLPALSRRQIAQLCHDISRQAGNLPVKYMVGLILLNHIIQTDREEFTQLLELFGEQNLNYLTDAIANINNYFTNSFKPEQPRLQPLTELTELSEVTTDNIDEAREEFANNSDSDLVNILNADIIDET